MSDDPQQLSPDHLRPEHLRMVEALLFAAAEPLDDASLVSRLPDEVDIGAALEALGEVYKDRGVNLVRVAGRWALRTAPDLKFLLEKEVQVVRRLSRAAVETLAIIAYHQPITRAEIEETRGVAISKGTMDVLAEEGWIRPKGRRKTPGRPVTYGTTSEFLDHFGLAELSDLPGMEELKAAGLLSAKPPTELIAEARANAASAPSENEDEDQKFSEWDDPEAAGDEAGDAVDDAADDEAGEAEEEAGETTGDTSAE